MGTLSSIAIEGELRSLERLILKLEKEKQSPEKILEEIKKEIKNGIVAAKGGWL